MANLDSFFGRMNVMKLSFRRKFFLDGLLLTLVALAMRTVAMLFGAFVSRTVGAEGVGLYTVIMTVYSFAVTFATSGISLTVTRLVASAVGEGRREEVPRILRGAFLYSGVFGALGTLVLFIGAELIGGAVLGDARTVAALRVLALSLIPVAFSSVLSGYFIGVKRVAVNAAVQVVSQGVKILSTVLLVMNAEGGGTVGAVIALCVGITVTEGVSFLLIFLGFLLTGGRRSRAGAGAELPAVVKTAAPLALSAYVRSALLTLEHILIPRRLIDRGESPSEAYSGYATLHGMALPVITYPMTPLSSFSGLLVPELAEDTGAGRSGRMSRIATAAVDRTLGYAATVAVFVHAFSEELGYILYGSADAGRYIAMLAPVIPIMYLDHVTDSMLKGMGEQMFAMWVNITDSLLSVALVWLLIPRMGIAGYAAVIVVMEGYNFILSFLRLRHRVKFTLTPLRSLLLPMLFAILGTWLSQRLFRYNGSVTTPFWLVMKMLFGLCVMVILHALTYVALGKRRKKPQRGRKVG